MANGEGARLRIGAVEQSDEAGEARELNMHKDGPIVVDVRFAAYRCCSADIAVRTEQVPTTDTDVALQI